MGRAALHAPLRPTGSRAEVPDLQPVASASVAVDWSRVRALRFEPAHVGRRLQPSTVQHGLVVAQSQIRGAGLGVYTLQPLRPGTRLMYVSGVLRIGAGTCFTCGRSSAVSARPSTQCSACTRSRRPWYVFAMSRDKALDASAPTSCLARYINTCPGRNNCRFVVCHATPRAPYIAVVSTRAVKAGQELFMAYGPAFWRQMRMSPAGMDGSVSVRTGHTRGVATRSRRPVLRAVYVDHQDSMWRKHRCAAQRLRRGRRRQATSKNARVGT